MKALLPILGQLIDILAPVFICVALGYLWIRKGEKFDTPIVTKLVTIIGTPALVFFSLSTANIETSAFLQLGIASALAYFGFAIAGYFILPLCNLSRRAFLQTITFPNIGNMGLPICYFAFGERGLALAVAFFVVFVVLQFTVGIAVTQGKFSPRVLIDMPVIPATVIAVIFITTDTHVPQWLLNTTNMIGDLTIPLMLFTLGVSLASLKLSNLKVALGVSSLRLGIGLGVAVGLSWAMGFTHELAAIVILQCSMPVAVYTYLFAQLYDQQPAQVAGVVMVSTLMSLVSLPLVLLYLL